MKTIRRGTFETNSSSCHSVTIMLKDDWEDYKNHKKFINEHINKAYSEDNYYGLIGQMIDHSKFITFDELKKVVKDGNEDVYNTIKDMSESEFLEAVEDGETDLLYDLHQLDINVYFEDKYDDNWEITEGEFNCVKIVCANHDKGC